jgi:hypothetical protein
MRRNYTVSNCRVALGQRANDTPANPQASVSLDEQPRFPVATISNPRAPHTNFRDGPGNKSNVVARLANGTQVIILGSSRSPSSGHLYCRVQTASGFQGYVDHELVDNSCGLTFEQQQYVRQVDRSQEQEALRVFTGLAGIIIGIAPKNR